MSRDDQSLMRCVLSAAGAADLEKRYAHRRRLWFDGPYGGSVAFDKVMEREVGLYIAYGYSDIPGFIRRAKVRGRLRHPHLLPVLDFGVTSDNVPYFTEPFVEARELDSALCPWKDRRPFPLKRLVRALIGVCRAVAHAHEKGLCHLGLTPSEVQVDDALDDAFVTGGWEEVGAAQVTESEQRSGWVMPSPAYAAPEQAQYPKQELVRQGRGQLVDVHGLGGILYFALHDAPPNQAPPGEAGSAISLLRALVGGRARGHRGPLRPALQTSRRAVSASAE